MRPATTYGEWTARQSLRSKVRSRIRNAAVSTLGLVRHMDRSGSWIRFPFYHHVFEDERTGFERQLGYLAGIGQFISIDDAIDLLSGKAPLDGRYFCIGFDDGLKSCRTGALPILVERSVPAVFYVVSGMAGCSFEDDHPTARKTFGFAGLGTSLDFMSWADCRDLLNGGMTIGSHGRTHTRLSQLPADDARDELRLSKMEIEAALAIDCRHFCAPYGSPDSDFNPERDPALAQNVGYRSFATGQRGTNNVGSDVYFLRRDHLLAGWGIRQLDYLLSRL